MHQEQAARPIREAGTEVPAPKGLKNPRLLAVLAFLCLPLAGLVETATALKTYHLLNHAARQASLLASRPGATEAEVRAVIAEDLASAGLDPDDVQVGFRCDLECFGPSRLSGSVIEVMLDFPTDSDLVLPLVDHFSGAGDLDDAEVIQIRVAMRAV